MAARWTAHSNTWISLTQMPSRCLWGRFRAPGQKRNYESFLSPLEPCIRSTSSVTARQIPLRAKVGSGQVQKWLWWLFDLMCHRDWKMSCSTFSVFWFSWYLTTSHVEVHLNHCIHSFFSVLCLTFIFSARYMENSTSCSAILLYCPEAAQTIACLCMQCSCVCPSVVFRSWKLELAVTGRKVVIFH